LFHFAEIWFAGALWGLGVTHFTYRKIQGELRSSDHSPSSENNWLIGPRSKTGRENLLFIFARIWSHDSNTLQTFKVKWSNQPAKGRGHSVNWKRLIAKLLLSLSQRIFLPHQNHTTSAHRQKEMES